MYEEHLISRKGKPSLHLSKGYFNIDLISMRLHETGFCYLVVEKSNEILTEKRRPPIGGPAMRPMQKQAFCTPCKNKSIIWTLFHCMCTNLSCLTFVYSFISFPNNEENFRNMYKCNPINGLFGASDQRNSRVTSLEVKFTSDVVGYSRRLYLIK